MKRLLTLCGVAILVAAIGPAATAGGGCHSAFTDGRTTTVELKDLCFAPTVARIQPGDTVTFENVDPVVHAVGGVGDTFGGHAEVKPGESLSFEFAEEGVFPYMCIYHPSMGGAIVVGDGEAKGSSAAIAPVDTTSDAAGDQAPAKAAAVTATRSGSERGWVVGAGIAVGLVLLLVAAIPRRRSVPQP